MLLVPAFSAPPGDYVVHADALRGERYTLRVRLDPGGLRHAVGVVQRVPFADLASFSGDARRIAVGQSPAVDAEFAVADPDAANIVRIGGWTVCGPFALADWEPAYGRLAEAQVVWEAKHGHALSVG